MGANSWPFSSVIAKCLPTLSGVNVALGLMLGRLTSCIGVVAAVIPPGTVMPMRRLLFAPPLCSVALDLVVSLARLKTVPGVSSPSATRAGAAVGLVGLPIGLALSS